MKIIHWDYKLWLFKRWLLKHTHGSIRRVLIKLMMWLNTNSFLKKEKVRRHIRKLSFLPKEDFSDSRQRIFFFGMPEDLNACAGGANCKCWFVGD